MSLVRAYRLRCDACGTGLAYVETARKARDVGRRRGWKRIPKNGREGERGRDFCPRCGGPAEGR